VQEIELSWRDELVQEGLEKGLEKGRDEGVVQGKRDSLKRLLTSKFGSLPDDVAARIEALSSAAELDQYLDRVLTASSFREMGLQD
jgi:flagellar biosynthesis/type III secretory pathway protein FliH